MSTSYCISSLEVGSNPLFLLISGDAVPMAHPLIPRVIELAQPIAATLELEVVDAVYQTNQRPPVLRVDVRHQGKDTGLDDCEQMSRALESILDQQDIIPEAYVLEISSPGLTSALVDDRAFTAFRGFPIIVQTDPPFKGNAQWTGTLISRDDNAINLNLKGRVVAIPRTLVTQAQLQNS